MNPIANVHICVILFNNLYLLPEQLVKSITIVYFLSFSYLYLFISKHLIFERFLVLFTVCDELRDYKKHRKHACFYSSSHIRALLISLYFIAYLGNNMISVFVLSDLFSLLLLD